MRKRNLSQNAAETVFYSVVIYSFKSNNLSPRFELVVQESLLPVTARFLESCLFLVFLSPLLMWKDFRGADLI